MEDKKLFNLPLPIRLKWTVPGMTMWIERIEMIFQQKEQNDEHNLDTMGWFIPKTKKWKMKEMEKT